MGLLTILKKMKQKERELRLLMLYPQSDSAAARVAGPAGWAGRGRRGYPLQVVRHARGATTAWCGVGAGRTTLRGGGLRANSRGVDLKAGPGPGSPVSWGRRGVVMVSRTSRSLGLARRGSRSSPTLTPSPSCGPGSSLRVGISNPRDVRTAQAPAGRRGLGHRSNCHSGPLPTLCCISWQLHHPLCVVTVCLSICDPQTGRERRGKLMCP